MQPREDVSLSPDAGTEKQKMSDNRSVCHEVEKAGGTTATQYSGAMIRHARVIPHVVLTD